MAKKRILKPLGYIEILDKTFDIYKKYFLLLFGICGIILIPFHILDTYYLASFKNIMQTKDLGQISFFVYLAASSIIYNIATAAVIWAVSGLYLGNKPSILESYSVIFKRILPFTLTIFFTTLLISVGLVLCTIPGIIILIITSFVIQILVLENKQYINAIRRSSELVKNEWTRVLVLGLLTFLIIAAFNLPLHLMYRHVETPMADSLLLLKGLVSGIVQALLAPIQTTAFVLLYYDIRIRKEGFDIEMLAADLSNPISSQE